MALQATKDRLLAERHESGMWRGELSSSALATATAVLALRLVDPAAHEEAAQGGLRWLAATQCADGGWGDTTLSLPNISTTLLCWAAFGGSEGLFPETVQACQQWIQKQAGGLEPATLAESLRRRYGKDQTFSVPILMACALGGRLGPAPRCWKLVPQLPFQLAALPRQWFAALSLPVVSYALPALVAIGQVRHFHSPTGPGRWMRSLVRERTLRLLAEIQPDGGGYLEATPLTSFVTMALAGMELKSHPVAQQGVGFLLRSRRADGSWPIDTDLATWGTTLAVKALGPNADLNRSAIREWLLQQQFRETHPYTLSAPGGWAWTDLPGGVPDADDTSGALLALGNLGADPRLSEAVSRGINWLLQLQNHDGGMPTFCRGWGTLPFDRSSPELTAHALAAWSRWPRSHPRLAAASRRALRFLQKHQQPDGAWEPLWFGNQWCPQELNLVYGTAAVLRDLCLLKAAEFPEILPLRRRAAAFLQHSQHHNGGWGGRVAEHASIEETALALQSLVRQARLEPDTVDHAKLDLGTTRLLDLTRDGTCFPAAPIGLYFARLWYHERLYPTIWTVAALREVAE